MIKRIFCLLITVLFIFIYLPLKGNFVDGQAYDYGYYPMACDLYEVSQIENGDFKKVSCHSNFEDAKQVMKTNDDYVVRYAKSYSPSKIVAMNSGIVVTYPGRNNSSIMNIYQDMNLRDNYHKQTYVSEHNEAFYLDTPTMSSDYYPNGCVYINLNGFEGYTSLVNVDLIPSQFLENGWSIWLGGNNDYYDEDPYNCIVEQDYFMLVNDGKYTSMQYTYHYTYARKKGNKCTSHSYLIDNGQNYLAAGMKLNTKYYSYDGINYFADDKCQDFIARVYNYYQFLPLRSKTNISGKTLDNYLISKIGSSSSSMKNEGETFIECQNKYGCNALIVYAMACLESGLGVSTYANDRYNLFGWAAYDESPSSAASFESIEDCLEKQMGQNLRYYMDYDHSYYFGSCVGNKGAGFNVCYASDPHWGYKIAYYAYSIDKFANNNNGQLSDYNSYTLGLVETFDAKIYKNSNNSDVLYTARYGKNYQKDLTVIVLDATSLDYQIQASNPIVDGERLHATGTFTYDWDNSIGYLKKEDVTLLNNQEELISENLQGISVINSLSIKDSTLNISGLSLIEGLNFDSKDDICQQLVFYSAYDDSVIYSAYLEVLDSEGFDLNDGYNYQYCGFKGQIDLKQLNDDIDSYYLKIVTTNHNYQLENNLRSSSEKYRYLIDSQAECTYKLSCNYLYNYRLELDILDHTLEYDLINKPSKRSSLASYNSITLDENGDLSIVGIGLIYYLDFVDLNDLSYKVYLINSDQDIYELKTEIIESEVDYTSLLNSSNSLTNITFKATSSGLTRKISSLNGQYKIIVEIKNGEYLDYVELSNRSLRNFNSINVDNKEISLKTSNVRKRLYLEVK